MSNSNSTEKATNPNENMGLVRLFKPRKRPLLKRLLNS